MHSDRVWEIIDLAKQRPLTDEEKRELQTLFARVAANDARMLLGRNIRTVFLCLKCGQEHPAKYGAKSIVCLCDKLDVACGTIEGQLKLKCGTCEQLLKLLERAADEMSPAEKAGLRNNIRRQFGLP